MSTACTTEDYSLIRTSLSRPAYKEKFRLRSYGVPGERSLVFAEIKKKFDGVVYKRRVEGEPETIQAFVDQGKSLPADSQIQREITCFLKRYHPEPRVFIAYERLALAGKEEDLRITFDRNIRWRDRELDLRAGDQGSPVLADDGIVMEIKVVLFKRPGDLSHQLFQIRNLLPDLHSSAEIKESLTIKSQDLK